MNFDQDGMRTRARLTARNFADGDILHIEIEAGCIHRIIREPSENDAAFPWIAPGLIDNQVNGFASIDFGKPDLTPADLLRATEALRTKGITTFVPTIITNSHERLLASFKALGSALKQPDVNRSVPGFHLEGPYISPEKGYRGAHQPEHIRHPDWDEFRRLNDAAEGRIIQVTLAPELPGAPEFIQRCAEAGIVVGLAHHHANREQIRTAIDHGAKISTHLGNGCANQIHRHHNVLWHQLDADELRASIIVDGVHNPPEVIRAFYKLKTPQRLILTSDAVLFAGMPPGKYDWDGRAIEVTPDGIVMFAEGDSFAGSASSLDSGISNLMHFTSCSLREAIQMASTNPATLLNLNDRGHIRVGKRADLILFNFEKGRLEVIQTLVAGKNVYKNVDSKPAFRENE
ncbi:N-acetylglucosamine-6-phosphate deacetylase [candidate division KSB1 bacterium]|nr:N-acetylglucosamine-6-phosphate deacetylase [candidate division KSB1 bacterium]